MLQDVQPGERVGEVGEGQGRGGRSSPADRLRSDSSGPFVEDRVFDLGDLQPVVPRQCLDMFTSVDSVD